MGHLNGCVTSTSVCLLIKVQYLLCVLLLFCGKNTLIFNPSLLFLFLYFPKYTSVKFDWSNVTCLVCKLTEVKRSPSCQWLHFLLKITVVLDWICECLEIIVKKVPNTTQIPCTVKFCMSEKSYVQSWRPCNRLTFDKHALFSSASNWTLSIRSIARWEHISFKSKWREEGDQVSCLNLVSLLKVVTIDAMWQSIAQNAISMQKSRFIDVIMF